MVMLAPQQLSSVFFSLSSLIAGLYVNSHLCSTTSFGFENNCFCQISVVYALKLMFVALVPID